MHAWKTYQRDSPFHLLALYHQLTIQDRSLQIIPLMHETLLSEPAQALNIMISYHQISINSLSLITNYPSILS